MGETRRRTNPLARFGLRAVTGLGHKERLPPSQLSGCCRFGTRAQLATGASRCKRRRIEQVERARERDAPIPSPSFSCRINAPAQRDRVERFECRFRVEMRLPKIQASGGRSGYRLDRDSMVAALGKQCDCNWAMLPADNKYGWRRERADRGGDRADLRRAERGDPG